MVENIALLCEKQTQCGEESLNRNASQIKFWVKVYFCPGERYIICLFQDFIVQNLLEIYAVVSTSWQLPVYPGFPLKILSSNFPGQGSLYSFLQHTCLNKAFNIELYMLQIFSKSI